MADRQLLVHVALVIDENMTGQRGADNLHYALEAACAAAAESFMRTHNGVLSWVAIKQDNDLAFAGRVETADLTEALATVVNEGV